MAEIPQGYKPNGSEPFMNDRQQAYFRAKLLAWKEFILNGAGDTRAKLSRRPMTAPDIADMASIEAELGRELRTRDRERKLLGKIDAALARLEEGKYGYCEETGAPISIKRLEARPVATLCIEAQERHEDFERTHRENNSAANKTPPRQSLR